MSERRRWWFHAAALAVVLFGILALARPSQVISADEGAVLSEVRTLSRTDQWTLPVHTDIDPDGAWFGLHQPVIVGDQGDRAITFDRPPTYPLLLVPLWNVGGLVAVLALHVAGVWAAAVLAGRLTERLVPGRGLAAMWLCGVASPLLFDGYWAIAHSLVAAGATAAALGAVRFAFDGRRVALVWWLAGLVLAVGLRTEPLFAAAGLSVALAVVGWREASVRWRAWPLAVATSGVAGAVLVGMRRWQQAIEGVATMGLPSPSSGGGGYLASRVSGFRHSALGAGFGDRTAAMVVVASAACIVGAVVLSRFDVATPRVRMALAAAGAGTAVLRFAMADDMVTGLLMAAPLVIAAACCLPRERWRDPATTVVATTAALTVAAVVATQHERGGTGEWGGRYFHVVLPLICVVAVVSLDWLVAHRPEGRRVVAWGLVAALVFSVLSLRTAAGARDVVETRTELAWRAAQRTADASDPAGPVVVTTWIAGGRFAWRHAEAARYLLVDRSEFSELAARLRAAGVGEWVLLAQPEDTAHIRELEGYDVAERQRFGQTGWSVLVFGRVPAAPVMQG